MVTFCEINGAVNLTSAVNGAANQRADSMMDLVNPATTGNFRAEALGLVQRRVTDSQYGTGSWCHATACTLTINGVDSTTVPSMSSLLNAMANK